MNKKLAQLIFVVNSIDRRQFQFAGLLLMLAISFVTGCPSDGGGGPS